MTTACQSTKNKSLTPPKPKQELQKRNTSNYFTGTPHIITENSKAFAKDIDDNTKVYKNHQK